MNKIKMIIMRKIFITILGILTLWTPLKAQNNSRYYYAGEQKYPLRLVSDKRAIFRPTDVKNAHDDYVERVGKRIHITEDMRNANETSERIVETTNGELSLPIYALNENLEVVLLPEIVLMPLSTSYDMSYICNYYHLTLVKETEIYLLFSVPQNSDVLSIANEIYETGDFDFSYPNFFCLAQTTAHIPNDTYFPFQIACHNTGQTMYNNHTGTIDADINAPEAWDITKGSIDITVAVFDHGVTELHPDLSLWHQMRLPGSNFGSGNVNDPSPTGNANHGNACAGVIAATMDNNEGIAGIAPLCRIMPIRWDDTSAPIDMADGIQFAVDNGANIISCSWTYQGTGDQPNFFPAITQAISNAIRHNVVVVFSAGNTANHIVNNDGYVEFPANAGIPNLITVGASDRYDKMANYSPKSALIDFVAPSHRAYPNQIPGETFEMWSIDIPGPYGYNPIPYGMANEILFEGLELPRSGLNYRAYTGCFGGTSHACPVVAGVAALMLSINPNLTPGEVFHILKETSAKVGGYTYTNGKSEEMGYGRVDAYAAVRKAQLSMIEIDGPTYFCDSSYYYVRHAPEGSTFHWSISGEYLLGWGSGILGARNRDSVLIGRDMEPIKGGHSPVVPFPIIPDTICVLSITVTLDGVSYCKSRTIHGNAKGIPEIIASDTSTLWQRYTERTFTVTNCTEVPDDKLAWEAILTEPPFYNLTIGMARGRTFSFTPVTMGTYEIRVTNEGKLCGSNSTTNNYVVVNNAPSKAKGMVLKYQFPEDSCTNAFPQKLLRDGQLIIEKNDKLYNAQGMLIK